MKMTGRQLLAGIVSLAVVAAIAAGIAILGSPSEERSRRLDRVRVTELQGIRSAVAYFYSQTTRLPVSLDELSKQPGVRVSTDPVTAEAYRYRTVGADEYELCAAFERASEPQPGSGVDIWQHPAGAHCFTLKIEKRSTQ